ncbi:hypothetical protein CC1G_02808 [Coprinopsis cinerea okayama7|uniref:glutathione-specific gamma-glutamylcyclotransferase n=1 Tax=Coprinopsis cinerea (strain Okayama-7 / 130 / ATCC MYA-4618 / FGSC 9003) TaxID=240176 RepID=A8N039_COPC7|nr:hypothetical protein CC1G_02808 [Coprinopsis cinerea okayama7\|eukprot:XP_001828227.2 hypothetical protein CC1G_02808 [Coprinopsis cinerea okayama7\
MTENKPFVVFGYGSLIFKPPPHVVAKSSYPFALLLKRRIQFKLVVAPGFLKGYVRRFAQKSHDHRGTPENPGRVVTLVHKEDWDKFSGSDAFPDEDVVWGKDRVYHRPCSILTSRKKDFREKDGYTLETLDIYNVDSEGNESVIIHNAYCYVGRNDNPSFIGSEPLDALSKTIWRSVGPSGPNKEYLYRLADAVRELSPSSYDSHLFALEARLFTFIRAVHTT